MIMLGIHIHLTQSYKHIKSNQTDFTWVTSQILIFLNWEWKDQLEK